MILEIKRAVWSFSARFKSACHPFSLRTYFVSYVAWLLPLPEDPLFPSLIDIYAAARHNILALVSVAAISEPTKNGLRLVVSDLERLANMWIMYPSHHYACALIATLPGHSDLMEANILDPAPQNTHNDGIMCPLGLKIDLPRALIWYRR